MCCLCWYMRLRQALPDQTGKAFRWIWLSYWILKDKQVLARYREDILADGAAWARCGGVRTACGSVRRSQMWIGEWREGWRGAGPGLKQGRLCEGGWEGCREPLPTPSPRKLRPVRHTHFLRLHRWGPAQPLADLFPTPPERYFSFLSCGQESSEDGGTEK